MMTDKERESILEMHKILLETLRHREQEIFQYLALLVTAFGGFGWLLWNRQGHDVEFLLGTISILLLLGLGSFYSLSLGYNFRYIILQLAKFEKFLGVNGAILAGWPRTLKDFEKYKLFKIIPWCMPPGLIKIFWISFLLGFILVITTCALLYKIKFWMAISASLLLFILPPISYGFKFKRLLDKEYGDPIWAE